MAWRNASRASGAAGHAGHLVAGVHQLRAQDPPVGQIVIDNQDLAAHIGAAPAVPALDGLRRASRAA